MNGRTKFALITAIVLALAIPTAAFADGTVVWTGHGSDNLPCPGGAHWVLSNAQGITGATLIVNGNSYGMSQSGQGSWSADSGALGTSVTASANYTGDATGTPQLQLSHCNAAPTPTNTPDPTETPTPTNTPTNTPGPSPTPSNTPTNTPTNTPGPSPTPSNTPEVTSTPPEYKTGASTDYFPWGWLFIGVSVTGLAAYAAFSFLHQRKVR